MADYSKSDLNTLDGFIAGAKTALKSGDTRNAINDVHLYYEDQVGERGYAADALEVVNHIGDDHATGCRASHRARQLEPVQPRQG